MWHSSHGDGKRFPFSPALHQAFIGANAAHRASLDVLRDAICEYVEDLRDQGVPSPDIATALRHRVAELQSSGGITSLGVRTHGIVDALVASCLESPE
jgi:hypothetical protein